MELLSPTGGAAAGRRLLCGTCAGLPGYIGVYGTACKTRVGHHEADCALETSRPAMLAACNFTAATARLCACVRRASRYVYVFVRPRPTQSKNDRAFLSGRSIMPVVELCNGQKVYSCVTASHAAESAGKAGKALLWKKSLWDDLFTLWGWVCQSGLLF